MIFGVAQSLALIPGVSRSGATITAGLAMGYQRVAAARIPSCWPSPQSSDRDSSSWPTSPATRCRRPGDRSPWPPRSPFVIGYAVIAWLLRYISTHNFLPFVIYRLALAAPRGDLAVDRRAGTAPPALERNASLSRRRPARSTASAAMVRAFSFSSTVPPYGRQCSRW